MQEAIPLDVLDTLIPLEGMQTVVNLKTILTDQLCLTARY